MVITETEAHKLFGAARSELRNIQLKLNVSAVAARAPAFSSSLSQRLPSHVITVARSVFGGIFAVPVVMASAAGVMNALRTLIPDLFTDEKAGMDSRAIVGEAALTLPLRIGRIYGVVPVMDSPEIDFLTNYLALNPKAELFFSVLDSRLSGNDKGVGWSDNLNEFRNALIRKVQAERQKLGFSEKRVHLTLLNSAMEVIGRINQNGTEIGILFSDSPEQAKVQAHVLAIHNDRISDAAQTAVGLAFGIKALSQGRKFAGWRKLSSLLAEYLELAQTIQAAFAHSA